MKKLLTIALISMLALGSEAALAQGNGKGNGKAKGKPTFVDEKHQAHAEWKNDKNYAKADKKHKKKDHDCCDRDDRRRDDDRWSKTDRRDRDRDGDWRKRRDDRDREERRTEEVRTIGDIILGRNNPNQ